MSVFRKAYDRCTSVIGYDRRGKRLRAGDSVMLVGDEIPPELCGVVAEVVGKSSAKTAMERRSWGASGWVRIRAEGYSRPGRCQCHDLIRLDEGDDASWRQVGESTGWTPRTVSQPEEVPA